jgi:hypothetical protein
MHLAALLYLVVLSAILAFGLRSRFLNWPRVVVALFLLVWSALIVTAHLLSVFHALGSTPAYIIASIALAALIAGGLRLIPLERTVPFPTFEIKFPFGPRLSWYCGWFLALTAIAALAANVVLAWGMLPANPDSIVYRFSRVYWYLGHGSLMHFTNHSDPRVLYYPFNSSLAYLPLVHFQLGPRSFSVMSLLSWLMVGLTTYLFARDLGGSRLCAFATAWLVCLTPNVLLQALSTNDEIIAATPLLAGLYFLHRWYYGRQYLDVVLASIGIGISIGTKLHVMFYWPLLVAIAVFAIWNYRPVMQEAARWLNARGAAVFATVVLAILLLGFSFIAYNYLSAGRTSAWEYNVQVLNSPFSWRAALQTIVLYASQIVLTPIADLHFATDPGQRAQYYEAFNRVFAPFFTWVDNAPAFVAVSYRFVGVNSKEAFSFNEHTVFIGFTWLMAVIAGIMLCRRTGNGQLTWGRFHLASLPLWILTFAASTRYMDGLTVYLGYATIVAGPMLVYAFVPIGRLWADRARWSAIALVAMTHCFFALNIFLTSSPRNFINIARADHRPVSRAFWVDQSVLEETGRSTKGVYSHTIAWGQPHWVFMAYNPQVKQYLTAMPKVITLPPDAPSDPVSVALRHSRYVIMPNDQSQLHIYTFPQLTAYGHSIPIRIPDKSSPGLTWIGNMRFAFGDEWVFAAGNGVETRHAGRDRYIVIRFNELSNFGHEPHPEIEVLPTLYGLGTADDLSFRYELQIDGKVAEATDWNPLPQVRFKAAGMKSDNAVLSVFVRNNNAGGTVYRTDAPLRSTKPLPLAGG